MRRKALWLAALVVLLSNAVAFGFAWMNRSGEPEAVLTLTEREVRVLPRDTDNTAIGLRLEWIDPSSAPGAARWFDEAKLVDLGFDCSVPVTRENARFYRGQPPRSAYAAFELEGDSWKRHLEIVPSAGTGSHLVLIDVGLDPAALRARHPDRRRVIIAHATAGVVFREAPGTPPALSGRVTDVYPIELSVPKDLRGALEGIKARPDNRFEPAQSWLGSPLQGAPRFSVTVAWGRSLEPWLVAIDRSPTNLSGKNSVAQPQQ
jgi:hypothetical protein